MNCYPAKYLNDHFSEETIIKNVWNWISRVKPFKNAVYSITILMKKLIQYLFITAFICSGFGCSKVSQPVISITLTEKRAEFRLETSIFPDGTIFRGYYPESSNIYHGKRTSLLPKKTIDELWSAIESGPIEKTDFNSDTEGDFKSIGVMWGNKKTSYGTSKNYKDVKKDSVLYKALLIIQKHNIDKWIVLSDYKTDNNLIRGIEQLPETGYTD
ncbi:MAG: hypothetical protein GY714_18525 [Desulfobacterales bacterium]|nr:hypothetical protein [Desulfobacterales bacterium]